MPSSARHGSAARRLALTGAALVALLTAACGEPDDGPAPWLLDPGVPMPEWLSDATIYTDLPALEPARHFVAYTPPHRLYSNRAAKARLLWLPPDTAIDTADAERWGFPLGTVLVKTFSYRHVEGRYGDVAVETRIIRRVADGWQYGVYHWDAAGREARLAEARWPESRFLLEDVNGSDFPYAIPGELDCEACHDTHLSTPIIGLGPGNLDAELVNTRPDLFTTPPTPVELPARTPIEARAMSYLVGNCVHCHHGQRGSDNAAFDLRPEGLLANTVDVPTDSSASGDGIRIVPGDPAASALYEAVVDAGLPGYRGDFKPMPPVGIVAPDHDAAGILRAWIEELAE